MRYYVTKGRKVLQIGKNSAGGVKWGSLNSKPKYYKTKAEATERAYAIKEKGGKGIGLGMETEAEVHARRSVNAINKVVKRKTTKKKATKKTATKKKATKTVTKKKTATKKKVATKKKSSNAPDTGSATKTGAYKYLATNKKTGKKRYFKSKARADKYRDSMTVKASKPKGVKTSVVKYSPAMVVRPNPSRDGRKLWSEDTSGKNSYTQVMDLLNDSFQEEMKGSVIESTILRSRAKKLAMKTGNMELYNTMIAEWEFIN